MSVIAWETVAVPSVSATMDVWRASVVAMRWRRWLAVVAAVSVIGIAATTGTPGRVAEIALRFRTRMAVGRLVAKLRREQLPVARFSALGVSGGHSTMRGPVDVDGQTHAGELLDLAGSSSEPEAVAAAAAALAVGGSRRQAIVTLEAALARTPNDARLWSDLAAAQLEANEVLRALVAADRALRIDAQSADALYNRGLALERLGLSMVAAETWRRCLERSSDAALAMDLRERLRVAEAPSEAARWPAAEKELLRAGAEGETAIVSGLAEQFPRLVRVYAEGPYLTSWAAAVEAGDAVTADQWLRIVRTAGEALRRRGETLLSEAVAGIDDAAVANDTARVRLLAKAQRAYDRGRRAYRASHHEEAERELRDAAATFATLRSPMAQVARAFTASVLVNRMRIDEARAILLSLLAAERPSQGHRALVASSEYLLSVCETYAGRWNEAVDASKASAGIYRQLGEASNAADSEAMLGVILDLMGQPEEGWQYRIPAFRVANDAGVVNRLIPAVATATRAAMHANDRDLALSFLDVEMSLAARAHDSSLSADVLTRRAILQHERGVFQDRDNALARARIAVASIADGNERARYASELDAAEAVAIRATNPRRAIELSGRAIAYDQAIDRRPYLPADLLQRGRAFLTSGDTDAAWKDFAEAMDELEAQRDSIRDLTLRSRMFDTAEELFAEALALQVKRGDAEAAFAVAERARARGLLDATGNAPRPVASVSAIAGRLNTETMVVEYAVLPDAVVIFAIGRSGLRMYRVPAKADAFSLDRPDLGDLLLGPVRDDLAAVANVVFIPEKILQRVPFASLMWQGRYLIATHAVSVVPSASLLMVTPELIGPKERSVLIVGNPAPNPELKLAMLPSVEREVAAVGAIYRPADVLFGADATRARFVAEAPAYDVIHFAGHGVSDEESLTASLLFARSGSDPGRMYLADIEKLRLTRNPLVVLAACGTLRGRARGVEGMPSLARSFLAAGASTVVGTLWNVDDVQSGALMTSFHRQLAAGESPATALRNAQLRAIARGGADADPKNWAGFVVYTVRP